MNENMMNYDNKNIENNIYETISDLPTIKDLVAMIESNQVYKNKII